jgi:hypothetical protein
LDGAFVTGEPESPGAGGCTCSVGNGLEVDAGEEALPAVARATITEKAAVTTTAPAANPPVNLETRRKPALRADALVMSSVSDPYLGVS